MTDRSTRIRAAVETAVWAPSGDNSQPWHFTLSGDTLRIHLEPERDNPILNFRLSGTYIAHGALIENLVLAASQSGLAASVKLLPEPNDPLCTAAVIFSDADSKAEPLAASIRARHTNRKPYRKQPLVPETIEALKRAVESVSGARLTLTTDRNAIREIAAASAFMEQIALETPVLRDLFLHDIIWGDAENQSGKQGLYIKTMELPPPARFILGHFSNPLIARFARAVGFSKIARITDTQLYASASAMGVIAVDAENLTAYLTAGRALERVWLAAAREGLAFHPVTGILFLARSIAHGSAQEISPVHRALVVDAEKRIRRALGLPGSDIMLMLFRTGYAKPASARSFRRPPDIRFL